MSARYWIQILEPGHSPRVESIESLTELGRDCDGIVLDDVTVSRRHLTLEPASVGLILADLESANGTYVEGDRVTEPMVLQAGHRITCGECEITVHSAHDTESRAEGASGAELHADPSARVSEGVRKLGSASRKSTHSTERP